MNRVIAFFDFDGTITTKDSLLEFIKFVKGTPAFYFGFLLHLPVLILYKLKVVSNQRAKEIMLNYFFGKMTLPEFKTHCEKFMHERLPALLRPKALKEIEKLQQVGADVVIVSASPESWLQSWCTSLRVQCVATKLAVVNDKITGRIEGLNCHGEEKVRRIKNQFDLSQYNAVYAYGDTPGDRPMLALANYKFYKPFR